MLKKAPKIGRRFLTARRDRSDFRDLLYSSRFIRLRPEIPLEEYRSLKLPVLDQGEEGACTGFALATVIHFALRAVRKARSIDQVSPRWLYDGARRFDEWPGEEYEGSSCRGALKAWHHLGACKAELYSPKKQVSPTSKQLSDAKTRPLGAYFRVNHKKLYDMHCALGEAGILYCSGNVHQGWQNVGSDGRIHYRDEKIGGHAFAIVAYDKAGFWIQNSWGRDYGLDGFCHITYDDWLKNGDDCWISATGVSMVPGKNRGASDE